MCSISSGDRKTPTVYTFNGQQFIDRNWDVDFFCFKNDVRKERSLDFKSFEQRGDLVDNLYIHTIRIIHVLRKVEKTITSLL